ncbi:MAG: hypothetical protein NVS2B3_01460 [Vulcanimicrobiaceae bacterium]
MSNPLRKTNLEIRRVGEEVLVHDLEREKVHILNASAGDVLDLCDGEHSIADLTRALAAATGADARAIEPDVRAIVATFSENDLIRS